MMHQLSQSAQALLLILAIQGATLADPIIRSRLSGPIGGSAVVPYGKVSSGVSPHAACDDNPAPSRSPAAEAWRLKYYGNWGGLGNNGGAEAIDPLDEAYRRHDEGWQAHGTFDGRTNVALIEEIPPAVTSGRVGVQGVVQGTLSGAFFLGMHCIYSGVPCDGSSAFVLYKLDQASRLTGREVETELSRLRRQRSRLLKR